MNKSVFPIVLSAVSIISSCDKLEDKPNIVFIITEDICPDLSCYGRTDVNTPVLDSLAAQGVKYTNAFTTSPVCSPSRSAMITGMYQTSIGLHNHRSESGPLHEPVKPFTYYLRDAGYFTCNVKNDEYGSGKEDFNFEDNHVFDGTDWSQRKEGQPFFAQISIYTTHRDTHWYGIENQLDNPVRPTKVQLPSYTPDHGVTRYDWARYLNSIEVMDGQVGMILDRLDKEGLSENTVVIFIGDHGRCMVRGKQWLYDSGIKIPMIIRWPDRIKAGQTNDNMVSAIDISASILDVAGIMIPDYMEGIPFLDKKNAGRSEIYAARDRCDGVVDRIRCVRDKQFKYIRNFMPDKPYTQFGHYKEFFYPELHLLRVLNEEGKLSELQSRLLESTKPVEELYDIINDPEETINLAENIEYKEIAETMRGKLDSWIEETGDQGVHLESDEFMEAFLQKREEKYAPLWAERGIDPHDPARVHLSWWEKNLGCEDFHKNLALDQEGAERKLFKTINGQPLYAYFYYPKNFSPDKSLPAIVFFHGGGWRNGSSTQFHEQCRYLASRGMIAIQADYRTMQRDGVTPFESVQDAKSAVRWIRSNAKELGVNPDMLAAGGGSAGGHLAAACGIVPGLEDSADDLSVSSVPNALVLFNPVFNNGPDGYRYDLFGDHYKEISPAHNIRKNLPPTIVFLGTEDSNLSVELAETFDHEMKDKGNISVLKLYEGQKHGFFNKSKGGYKMYAITVYEMDKFLESLGYLNGDPEISLEEDEN